MIFSQVTSQNFLEWQRVNRMILLN